MEIFRFSNIFFFRFNPNFLTPLPFSSLFFFSIPMEENYRACHRNTIHKRISRGTFDPDQNGSINSSFHHSLLWNSSLQLRQVVVPFPTETIISSVWFRLEKRLVEWRTKLFFTWPRYTDQKNFISEWGKRRRIEFRRSKES